MRNLIILLLALNFPTLSFGCVCEIIDSTNIGDWMKEADFVVEGEYMTNINPNDELRNGRNGQNLGFDILFKITTVIKGTVSTDTIALIQFDNGSCTETFERGEKYIIFGAEIKKFLCRNNKLRDIEPDSTGEYAPTDFPPPGSFIDDKGTMTYYNCDDEESQYWDSIAMNYVTTYVSYCTAIHANSRTGQLIKRN